MHRLEIDGAEPHPSNRAGLCGSGCELTDDLAALSSGTMPAHNVVHE
jgi:hypothetical protein